MATSLFVYLSWCTRGRAALIEPDHLDPIKTAVRAAARESAVRVVAIGVLRQQVQLVAELPARFDLPAVTERLKAAAQIIAQSGRPLQWDPGFDARSLSPGRIGPLATTISQIEQRHPDFRVGDGACTPPPGTLESGSS